MNGQGDYGILIFIGVAILILVAAIVGWLQERKRAEAFRKLAARLGLRYIKRDKRLIPNKYRFLDQLRKGSNRYAFNILEGTYRGHPVHAFDYHYETRSRNSKGQSQTTHHYFSFFLLEQPEFFPELRIYPSSMFSWLASLVGASDINFESIEFSKAFTVRSKDRKFAYDICHTRMMEYLLQKRELSIEIEGHCVALAFPKRLAPAEIETRLDQLCEIRELFPEYLYRA